MSSPILLAVAHGSADPLAAVTVGALADQVTRLAPVIDIRTAFIQHGEPSLADGLAAAGADVVIVPLLLSTGYHLTADIAAAARVAQQELAARTTPGARPRAASPRVAGPLGPDPLLVTALAARLAEAGVPAGTPVVLAAAGSSDPRAAEQVARQASMLAEERGAEVVVAFAAPSKPTVREAVADLRAKVGGPVAVASYLLAPGHFQDRLADSEADWVTAPLGDHPAVAALVIDRYRAHRTTA
jgi:sirohydrochlorin ferrochelatase